jgi:uncharacterized hydrophobic protein (TIGR00271 family)
MQMDHRPTLQPTRLRSLGDLLHGSRVGMSDVDDIRNKLFFDREPTRDAYVRFGVLLVLSVVIGTGGIITDSTATVIGAMIVAPLMTPIMATALAIVTGDGKRIWRSLLIVAAGVGIAVGLSWLMGILSTSVVTTAKGQVAGRISPRTTDLVVALASGAAGGFALGRSNVSDALPGVAIAISLVPPLCVVGVMLANGDPSAAAGAMLLFVTNFLAILIAGGGSLALMGFGRAALGDRHSTQRRRAAIVIAIATGAILVPLIGTAISVGRDSSLEASVNGEATTALRGTTLQLYSVTSSGGKVEVVVAGNGSQDVGAANRLASILSGDHPGTQIEVRMVPSTLIVQGPPTGG